MDTDFNFEFTNASDGLEVSQLFSQESFEVLSKPASPRNLSFDEAKSLLVFPEEQTSDKADAK